MHFNLFSSTNDRILLIIQGSLFSSFRWSRWNHWRPWIALSELMWPRLLQFLLPLYHSIRGNFFCTLDFCVFANMQISDLGFMFGQCLHFRLCKCWDQVPCLQQVGGHNEQHGPYQYCMQCDRGSQCHFQPVCYRRPWGVHRGLFPTERVDLQLCQHPSKLWGGIQFEVLQPR